MRTLQNSLSGVWFILTLLLLLTQPSVLAQSLLYSADFDEFETGNNAWGNDPEWDTNDSKSGAQQISSAIPSLGKVGIIGFNQPANSNTGVFLPLGYRPTESGGARVEIITLLRLYTNDLVPGGGNGGSNDRFFISIYNSDSQLLGSVGIYTRASERGFWRITGAGNPAIFTGVTELPTGDLYELVIEVDLARNQWSADLLGVATNVNLFSNEELNAGNAPVNMNLLSFEWELTAANTSGHGNNFMMYEDIEVSVLNDAFESNLELSKNLSTLEFTTKMGRNYTIEQSTNLLDWNVLTTFPTQAFSGRRFFKSTLESGGDFYRVGETTPVAE